MRAETGGRAPRGMGQAQRIWTVALVLSVALAGVARATISPPTAEQREAAALAARCQKVQPSPKNQDIVIAARMLCQQALVAQERALGRTHRELIPTLFMLQKLNATAPDATRRMPVLLVSHDLRSAEYLRNAQDQRERLIELLKQEYGTYDVQYLAEAEQLASAYSYDRFHNLAHTQQAAALYETLASLAEKRTSAQYHALALRLTTRLVALYVQLHDGAPQKAAQTRLDALQRPLAERGQVVFGPAGAECLRASKDSVESEQKRAWLACSAAIADVARRLGQSTPALIPLLRHQTELDTAILSHEKRLARVIALQRARTILAQIYGQGDAEYQEVLMAMVDVYDEPDGLADHYTQAERLLREAIALRQTLLRRGAPVGSILDTAEAKLVSLHRKLGVPQDEYATAGRQDLPPVTRREQTNVLTAPLQQVSRAFASSDFALFAQRWTELLVAAAAPGATPEEYLRRAKMLLSEELLFGYDTASLFRLPLLEYALAWQETAQVVIDPAALIQALDQVVYVQQFPCRRDELLRHQAALTVLLRVLGRQLPEASRQLEIRLRLLHQMYTRRDHYYWYLPALHLYRLRLYVYQNDWAQAEVAIHDTEAKIGSSQMVLASGANQRDRFREVYLNLQVQLALAQGNHPSLLPLIKEWFAVIKWEPTLSERESRHGSQSDSQLSYHRFLLEKVCGLLLDPKARRDPALVELALQAAALFKGTALDKEIDDARLLQELKALAATRGLVERWRQLVEQREQLLWHGLSQAGSDGVPTPFRAQQSEAAAVLSAQIVRQQDALTALPEVQLTIQRHRALLAPATIRDELERALPASAVLVEIVRSSPFDATARSAATRWGRPHLVAILLSPGQPLLAQDLGEEAELEQQVAAFMAVLRNPSSAAEPVAQELYQRILKPLRRAAVGKTTWYLSLEGALHLIPFAALHDGDDFLIRRLSFVYLHSARQLLPKVHEPATSAAVVIMADPRYESAALGGSPGAAGGLAARLSSLVPLPGARDEAAALKRLVGDAQLYIGAAATEETLRAVHSPLLLHIATHGVFLLDTPHLRAPLIADDAETSQGRNIRPLPGLAELPLSQPRAQLGLDTPDPLSRSALLLATADRGALADQDGVLTGAEVQGLDLRNTQLVVLSSCDSGVGAVQVGQGVYGLRSAFFAAGAETLISSLWQVSDSSTAALMTNFYERLFSRAGLPPSKGSALHAAMQEQRARRPHPYFWAPFILVGDDGPLRPVAGTRQP